MAKEKKGKSEGKKAKAAEKKQKAEKKAVKKAKSKSAKQDGSDAEDVDLDQVLEEYKRQQEQFLKITETVVEGPPVARAAATFLASPAHANQLLLFGGEYFNGALATFFNDLHVYYIDRDEWRCVTSPNTPLPRSGHAWCRGGNQSGSVFLFGGEFSSPKQGTFYHYNDFWRLDAASREWTRLDAKRGSKSPPARSGHRMTYFKNYIILFGGFQDTAHQTRYLADLWLYDTANFVWHAPELPSAQLKPDARSSFTLLPHEKGAVLYGGFSRVKAAAGSGKGGGGKQGAPGSQKTVMKAVVHQDCFFLRITPPAADAAPGTPPVVRWERRKKPANAPNPPRAGATMAYHKGRGIQFGGVHDVEESEEGLDSEFFNQLFAWNIERNRFFPLALRKPRAAAKKTAAGGGGGGGGSDQRVGRRNRAAANEEELLRQLAALEASAKGNDDDDDDVMEVDQKEPEPEEAPVRQMPVSMEMPHARFNSLLAVQGDVLYLYGGTYEKGDREFTFDDLHAVDLGKLDGCKEVFSRPMDDAWIESEDEDDEDDEDDDDEEEDDEDDEDIAMEDANERKKFTPSTRKKNKGVAVVSDDVSEAGTESTFASPVADSDDTETETMATSVDDGLPHPRPFESRRDFFNRTSNEWQEILMTNLRWKNVKVEAMAIKEIKTKAFELSEEKWWDCREEITALEDEQEAAGIGEVVSLADRGEQGRAAELAAAVRKDGGSSSLDLLRNTYEYEHDTMPVGIQRLNAKRTHPNEHIVFIKPLKGPDEDAARDFLERIAAQCVPIMRDHHLSVMTLEEFPPNAQFVGRNFNAGEVIQLVLKARGSGRWLPFSYVQMVMMHELAHCRHMNHARAFWAVRDAFAAQMRGLWARRYAGEGLWGRGARLGSSSSSSESIFAQDPARPGDDDDGVLMEHLCGGTFRSRRAKKRKPALTYQEQKERRIRRKFGAAGLALGGDVAERAKLEGAAQAAQGRQTTTSSAQKRAATTPRVAKSKRGRELRAAAALARFEDKAKQEEEKKEEEEEEEVKSAIKKEADSSQTSDSEYELADADALARPDAVDIDGTRMLDGHGHGLVRVCEDEDLHDDADAKRELQELLQTAWGQVERPAQTRPKREPGVKDEVKAAKAAKAAKEEVKDGEPRLSLADIPLAGGPSEDRKPAAAAMCAICSFANEPRSVVCAMCAHVLSGEAAPGAWRCRSAVCSSSRHVNAGDCGVCGVCGVCGQRK